MLSTARVIAASALACASVAASAEHVVLNPGFDAGVRHWQYEHFRFRPHPLWAHTGPGIGRGTYCEDAQCLDTLNVGAYISQHSAHEGGELYGLSRWVRSFAGASQLSVFVDGAMLVRTGTRQAAMRQDAFIMPAPGATAALPQVSADRSRGERLSANELNTRSPPLPMLHEPVAPALPVSEPTIYGMILAALGIMMLTLRRPIT